MNGMDLDREDLLDRHDTEEAETLVCDVWDEHGDELMPVVIEAIVRAEHQMMTCGCPACVLQYHLLWLGWERLYRLHQEREDRRTAGLDFDPNTDL